ncbi:hypothetical protein EVAR_60378_1 [Eumeta japonica]|uniref:Uncharacterized protein n=1 Tax=Eumeta variegata TaxID=151549 RepID=A0A4C1ZQJ3_EUMVA|nr:hypothetical protein EVAR_60378_1 [Eumeta japonica]
MSSIRASIYAELRTAATPSGRRDVGHDTSFKKSADGEIPPPPTAPPRPRSYIGETPRDTDGSYPSTLCASYNLRCRVVLCWSLLATAHAVPCTRELYQPTEVRLRARKCTASIPGPRAAPRFCSKSKFHYVPWRYVKAETYDILMKNTGQARTVFAP